MSRKRGPKQGPTPRRDGRTREPLLPGFPGARNWPDVVTLVDTLDTMMGARNLVLGELGEHLTDRHKAMLGWPLDRLDPVEAAAARARGLDHEDDRLMAARAVRRGA